MTDLFERARDVEIWIETAKRPAGDVAASVATATAAGTAVEDIYLIIDPDGGEDADEARLLVDALGIGELPTAVSALNARLDQTAAATIVMVRSGRMVSSAPVSIASFLVRFPEVDVVYGDSLDLGGRDVLRPAFSPVRLRGNDYLGPIVAMRVAALRQAGGFNGSSTDAAAFTLALNPDAAVALLPEVLATSDRLSAYGSSAQEEAVVEQVPVGSVVEELAPGLRRVRYPVQGDPLVTIVIPTRGSSAHIAGRNRALVVEAVRGIVDSSTYQNLEFVIVADTDTPVAVLDELVQICGDRLNLLRWDEEFNFSAKMNRGAAAAHGEYLLLLNDDVELISIDWIETMLGIAQQPGVGIVGAQLYFEDSTLQHAGQVYAGGAAGHAAFGWAGGRDDVLRSLSVDREVSGVTAACALISRALYLEVGGFTLALPGNYNDVDLNLKVRAAGRTAVFSPWVRLYHFESKTRDPRILPSDLETLQSRWLRRMQVEMYSRML